MKRFIFNVVIVCSVTVFLGSCSLTGGKQGKKVQLPLKPLSCIAVLPADTSVNQDDTIQYGQAKSLEGGAAFVSSLLNDELSEKKNVRLLSSNQIASLAPDVSSGVSGAITAIGQKVNCDGVLITTVRRFKQRRGSEYSVETPAAADVQMVLRHSKDGALLWTGSIRETQQGLLSNIFSFEKMQKRGFKWVTVEELVSQGVKKQLAECPYFK